MNNFGLIGKDISYSFSPRLHQIIAKHYQLNLNYHLLDVEKAEVIHLINDAKYQGFNVTKPYKKIVFQQLHNVTSIAKKTNAVNTIYYENGKAIGDNTDYYGFKYLIKYYQVVLKDKNVAILGTGGSAQTIYHYLSKESVKNIKMVSRNTSNNNNIITYEETRNNHFDIIINATPLGTYPNVDEIPPIDPEKIRGKVLIDLTYNPLKTQFMSYSDTSYNGLVMLIVQALYAHKKWQSKKIVITHKKVSSIMEEMSNV